MYINITRTNSFEVSMSFYINRSIKGYIKNVVMCSHQSHLVCMSYFLLMVFVLPSKSQDVFLYILVVQFPVKEGTMDSTIQSFRKWISIVIFTLEFIPNYGYGIDSYS